MVGGHGIEREFSLSSAKVFSCAPRPAMKFHNGREARCRLTATCRHQGRRDPVGNCAGTRGQPACERLRPAALLRLPTHQVRQCGRTTQYLFKPKQFLLRVHLRDNRWDHTINKLKHYSYRYGEASPSGVNCYSLVVRNTTRMQTRTGETPLTVRDTTSSDLAMRINSEIDIESPLLLLAKPIIQSLRATRPTTTLIVPSERPNRRDFAEINVTEHEPNQS